MNSAFPQSGHAFVKSILSGDSVVIRLKPQGGPPPELAFSLSNIVSPRLASKNLENEEDFAFESKEFLREFLIGKEVVYKIEYQSASNRAYGTLKVQHPINNETIVNRIVVAAGWAKVKSSDPKRGSGDEQDSLSILELDAQNQKLGIWQTGVYKPRQVFYTFDRDPRMFLKNFKSIPIPAIIEQVRDGSSLRLLLLLEQDGINVHQYVTVLISGIKCPVYRKDIPNVEDLVEPFAEEAKFFVETRLLNKKIHVLLESVTGQGTNINFYGSIQHPVGNIAEFLLKEGYAKVLDWNLAVVTNSEKYKPCELLAKSKKLRVWKSFVKQTNDIGNSSNQFQAEVTKILGPDFIQVEHQGKARKIYFSSIRGPKRMKNDLDCEIGYYVNAIEYLRTRLIGQKVSIKIDYIKPAEGEYEQRECATIKKGESNIAEGLVSKGYAYVIKHRKDDHSRSSAYDSLLHAEEKAIEAAKGVHSTKELPIHRIIDASENLAKAKSYFAQLQRADKLKGVVEYVASGSRFRILVPTLSLRLTFILSGIKTPRSARGDQKGEPYGTEALAFSSKRILQREVEFMVEGQDKAGSFIGTLLTGSDNLAILLLQEGLSTVHEFSASGSPYASQWKAAQEEAKELKKNIWKNYVMDTVTKEVEEFKISQDTPKIVEVIVCEIASDGVLNLQIVGPDLSKLEKLMSDFANHHSGVGQQVMTPFTPKVGDYCSAQFSVDKQWYRARVRKINGVNSYTVHYIDYGNSEPLPGSRLRALPQQFSVSVLKAQSHLAQLAYVDLAPIDGEFGEDAISLLGSLCVGDLAAHIVGVSSTSNGSSLSVVLYRKNNLVSINEELIRESLAIVTPAEVKRFDVEQRNNKKKFLGQRVTANSVKSELEKLIDAQTLAKRNRVNLWQYGDFLNDDDVN